MEAKKISNNDNRPALAYHVQKFFGILMLIQPIYNNTKWLYRIICEMCWLLFMVNDIFLLCGIGIGFYHFYHDIPTFTTVLFILLEIVVICEIICTSIVFKIQRLTIKVDNISFQSSFFSISSITLNFLTFFCRH